ncbi:MAG: polyhydroxyalkanoate depolymerase, partial [Burkholderiales bacterium]
MHYHAYEAYADCMSHFRILTEAARTALSYPVLTRYNAVRQLNAAYEVFAAAKVTHSRPDFGIASITINEGLATREVEVQEEASYVAPFGTLLHFKKKDIEGQPRVLIVAPMSGHFATLLRETARTMLADHDVYITDWHNARDVPLSAGRFGLDEYT